MNSLSHYDGRGLLVINGTQGIAPSVVVKAAERNATVLFTAPSGCEREAKQLLAQATSVGLSDRVAFIITDLVDEQSVEQLVDAAADHLPELSVLIHNLESQAVQEHRPLLDISLKEWNDVLASELRVPFMLARRVVEEFLFSQAPGRIVFLGYSGSGHVSESASYATAQAGLRALVRCITKEFGRREVACNAVVMPSAQSSESWPSRELIETVLFLATLESSFVNGEFLQVSGQPHVLAPMQFAGSSQHAER